MRLEIQYVLVFPLSFLLFPFPISLFPFQHQQQAPTARCCGWSVGVRPPAAPSGPACAGGVVPITHSPAGCTALAPVGTGFECGTAPQRTRLAMVSYPRQDGEGGGTPSGNGGERQVLQPLHHWVDADCGVKVHNTNKHCVYVCQRMLLMCAGCVGRALLCVLCRPTPLQYLTLANNVLPYLLDCVSQLLVWQP